MENEILEKKEKGKEEKTKKEGSKTGDSTQYRVVIGVEANTELERYLGKASEGKEPVDITKSDLANYVFCNLSRFLSESDLKSIRCQHFDERRVLQSLLKQASDGTELPEELRKAIRDHYGLNDREKRKSPKVPLPVFNASAPE